MGNDAHIRTPDAAAVDFRVVQAVREFTGTPQAPPQLRLPDGRAFLLWYFAYVLLADYAHDFMSTKVWGNINVGLVLGLLQFVTTFAITTWYVRYANRKLDPIADEIRHAPRGTSAPARPEAAMSAAAEQSAAPSRPTTSRNHAGQHPDLRASSSRSPWSSCFRASRNNKTAADYYAAGRSFTGAAERHRHRRRLPVRRVLPGHRRRDRHQRLRRLPVLHRLPGRLAGRAAAGRRAAAQHRQVHHGRRALLPAASSARCGSRRPSPRWRSASSTCWPRWPAPAAWSRCCSASATRSARRSSSPSSAR